MKKVQQLLMQFQSLIGFKINWNRYSSVALAPGVAFQSLIGFKINWNSDYDIGQYDRWAVSIPNRV